MGQEGPGPPNNYINQGGPSPPNVGAIKGFLTVKMDFLSTFEPFLQKKFRLKHKF